MIDASVEQECLRSYQGCYGLATGGLDPAAVNKFLGTLHSAEASFEALGIRHDMLAFTPADGGGSAPHLHGEAVLHAWPHLLRWSRGLLVRTHRARVQQVASERLQDAWRKAMTEARATSAPSVQRRPRSAVAPWRQARTTAADGGRQPVATTPSFLDTVVVTRRRRRVTSFAFPSGGAPTGASQVKIESNGMGRVASRWSHQPKQSPNPPVAAHGGVGEW